jgi:hypothetical protein
VAKFNTTVHPPSPRWCVGGGYFEISDLVRRLSASRTKRTKNNHLIDEWLAINVSFSNCRGHDYCSTVLANHHDVVGQV